MMPSVDELKNVIETCNKLSVKLVLVTPFIGEFELEKLKDLFSFIKQTKMDIEIVFNDWGVNTVFDRIIIQKNIPR